MSDQPQHRAYGDGEQPPHRGPEETYGTRYAGYGRPHPGPGPMPAAAPGNASGPVPSGAPAGTAAASATGQMPITPPGATAPGRPGVPGRAGGSPLIAPGFQPALLTAALAVLVGGAAPLGPLPLAAAVLMLQAVTAAGWFRLNGMWPARQGIALAFLGGLAADAGLLLTWSGQAAAVVLGTLGVWCLLTLTLHLRNRSGPGDERLYALTAAFTATALTVVAAGFLATLDMAGSDAVTAGCAAVAVAALARTLPLPPWVSPAVALLAAAGAGIAAGQLTGLSGGVGLAGPAAAGGLLGLVAGGCALTGLRVASYDYPSRFVHMTAGVALPLTLAAPAVYLLGRAFV
ncbi:hypothetical protein GCM10012287_17260 [Streptomyces daqingensis]|uniref:Integral membrane protein n=1 Tax=Streptomyces daqingensis TaxID=1472640 RepID=A0ABQ2M4C0_9ACTN|nr:hypothetical protein [Streptomyces daqingensis]GGO46575.1 hypothetical protein GCM10012287_17260 [Streptomyces daqingensis]